MAYRGARLAVPQTSALTSCATPRDGEDGSKRFLRVPVGDRLAREIRNHSRGSFGRRDTETEFASLRRDTAAGGYRGPMRALVSSFVLLALAATAGGTAKASSASRTFGTRGATLAPEISSNWSGYAAISTDPETPATFTDVTATWRVPKSTCTVSRVSSAAFWVGLGGYDPSSSSLEQLGTGADCDGVTKTPTYYAWWELVPASSVRIPLTLRAGDTITAAVLVTGQTIRFSLKDVTRHTRFSKVLTTTQQLDTASAEWIAEAPSDCSSTGRCRPVPLTNFGTVTFSNIAAIGNTQPGTLTDAAWTASAIELISHGSLDPIFGLADPLGDGVGALPGDASSDGRTFSVSWQRNLTAG